MSEPVESPAPVLPAIGTPEPIHRDDPSAGRAADVWALGSLILAWIAGIALINPVGDFPLNDDWAFGLPVESLLNEHTLKLTDFQSMTLIAQILWGALFCLPFGFSFTALRISTLTLGLVGIAAFYSLLRHLGARPRFAAIGAAVLAFNPFYVHLSCSFMSDVPCLSLMIAALLLIIRGVDRDRNGEVAAGVVIAIVAMFVRQIGLLVLIGFLVAYPLRRGYDRRWVWLAFVPTVAAVNLLMLYSLILRRLGQVPGLYDMMFDYLRRGLTDMAHLKPEGWWLPLRASVVLPMYLGLGCLPFTLTLAPGALARLTPARRRQALIGIPAFAVGLALLLARVNWVMPMTYNILLNFGMGVRLLPGAVPGAPRRIWIVVTAFAAMGLALLVLILAVWAQGSWVRRWRALPPGDRPWQIPFLATVGLLNFGPIACSHAALFDRYLLVFLPMALAILVRTGADRWGAPSPRWTAAAALVLAVYLGFGVAATRDYLAWNRVRWAAAAELADRLGLPPDEIDGGFEYNNFYNARERLRAGWVHRPGESGRVERPDLAARLAFQPLPDHDVLGYRDSPHWLPWGVSRIYMLNRRPAGSTSPHPARPGGDPAPGPPRQGASTPVRQPSPSAYVRASGM